MIEGIKARDFCKGLSYSEIIFIGIGNPYRSDDGIGWQIVQELEALGLPMTQIVRTCGEGASLIELMQTNNCVLMFDAVHSGAESGSIFRFDANQETLPARFFNYSTHALSVAEAIELARALGQLPDTLIVYGIEGKRFESGIGLSPEVKGAIPTVINQLYQDLESLRQAGST